MALPAGDWTVLEIIKLLIQGLTPVAVFLLGYLVNRSTRRLDEDRWARQKVVEERVKVYGQVAQTLNDIYCYFSYVGNWKDLSPVDLIARKRECDTVMHTTRALFSAKFSMAYKRFMQTCFREYAGPGRDALLRTRVTSPLGARSTAWTRASGQPWPREWDDRFVSGDKAASTAEVQSAYNQLLEAFHSELVIWEAAKSQPPEGSHSSGKR